MMLPTDTQEPTLSLRGCWLYWRSIFKEAIATHKEISLIVSATFTFFGLFLFVATAERRIASYVIFAGIVLFFYSVIWEPYKREEHLKQEFAKEKDASRQRAAQKRREVGDRLGNCIIKFERRIREVEQFNEYTYDSFKHKEQIDITNQFISETYAILQETIGVDAAGFFFASRPVELHQTRLDRLNFHLNKLEGYLADLKKIVEKRWEPDG